MTHSNKFSESGGLSKAVAMSTILLVAPLKYRKPMDFSAAFYTADVLAIQPMHMDLLRVIHQTCKQNFWVRKGWEGSINVWLFHNLEVISSIYIFFRFSKSLMGKSIWLPNGRHVEPIWLDLRNT